MAGYSEAVHIHDLRSQLLVFDSRFPKYPHFPLIRCSGHTPTPQIKRWVKKRCEKDGAVEWVGLRETFIRATDAYRKILAKIAK